MGSGEYVQICVEYGLPPQFTSGFLWGWSSGSETIVHSMGIILLLLSLSIPPITRNFFHFRALFDGTAFTFRHPGSSNDSIKTVSLSHTM
ncbi:hypothetical protein Tco_0324008 [Tanacetum coccineum]